MLDLEQIQSFYPESLRPFGRGLLRQYLQYKILESVADLPVSSRLRFVGGTCIHMIHGGPRFSEGLDFDALGLALEEFEALCRGVRRSLELDGCRVECAVSVTRASSASLRFPGLLHEQGLSSHSEEKFLLKVDTEPQHFEYAPDKAVLSRSDVLLRINVVPVDILLAQKIHCVLARKRAMGRDFFDVLYLMGKAVPHMGYLRSKTGIETHEELQARLLARWRTLDKQALIRDVSPFLPSSRELKRIELFPDLVESWRARKSACGSTGCRPPRRSHV